MTARSLGSGVLAGVAKREAIGRASLGMLLAVLTLVFSLDGSASAARDRSGPHIWSVSFRGTRTHPEIVIFGMHFGRRPAPSPRPGTSNLGKCGPVRGQTGSDYGRSLWIEDQSQLWSAGYAPYVDCMGLVIIRYTDGKIVYRLGSFYNIHYKQRNGFSHGIYLLAPGDRVNIFVRGTRFRTHVPRAHSPCG